jgi:4-amino-4-deoxy-L-arabinose transferase-like glycosyltransferase
MIDPDAARSMRRFDEEAPGPGDLPLVAPGQTPEKATAAEGSPAAPLLVAAAFIGCAWFSWRRLGSLIVDGGHELDVPRRLLEGASLYRDVSWNWGPLAPYVNAGLYRLFGVHADTLMWAGVLTAVLAALGLYLLARRFVGPYTSASVAIAFIAVSGFSRRGDIAIFNFVAPYNFSATYGITLAIWSVLLLVRHARSGEPATLAASAVLAGLAALTKVETAFAVAVAHGAFLCTVLPRPSRARLIAWGCGFAVAAAGYLAAARESDGEIWRSLVELINGGSRFYIADSMGIRDPGRSLPDVPLSLLAWAFLLAAARWVAREDAGPRERPLLALGWAVLLVLPAFVLEPNFFRAAPLLLAAGLVWIVVARRREGEAALDGRWREHLVVWAFALGALARIPLRTGVDHYGFYLLPPTLVCVAIGMTRFLATRGGPSLSPRILGAAAATVLTAVAVGGFLVSHGYLTKPVSEVRTARVHQLVNAGGPEATFIPYLSRLPSSTVCAAVPEGAGIVFAAGLTPPGDGMTAYIPMALHGPEAQRKILDAWKRKPPQVIVHWLVDQSSVFGYAGFGQDYGLELAAWISERYEVAQESPDGRATLLVPRQGG